MDQDVNANVVLTADNSQYDQEFMRSAARTDTLSSSLDTLSSKLNNISKSAGHKLVGFSAADIVSITATTAAYAAYEKQLTGLSTQAAVLNSNHQAATNTMKQYRTEVDNLTRSFGMSTSNAAQLEQTVVRMADNTASVSKLTKTFATMGQATQESANTVGTSLLQLQKSMGTPQRDTEKYANQLTVLSKRANTTASAISDFAGQLAPVARLANISQTDLQGFSTAFIKAGQDGYQAANTFTKMMGDVAYASQTGSPDLAKYANLVGMTTDNFKALGGTDQFIKIFDAINRQGPQAITTLNRMGLDGARTVRTVTAMAQSGGLASEIAAARSADPQAMNRGASASMDTLVEELKRLKAESAQLAEAIGQNFAGPAKIFIEAMTGMTSIIRTLAESPLGKISAWIIGLAAPFAAVAGAVLASAAALAKFSTAAFFLRGAPATGFKQQRALNAANGTTLEEAAYAGSGGWTTRAGFAGGAGLARLTRAGMGSGPSIVSRLAGYGMYGMGRGAEIGGQMIYGPGSTRIPGVSGTGGFDDPGRRANLFRAATVGESFAGMGAFRTAMQGQMVSRGITAFGGGFKTRDGSAMSYDDAHAMNQRMGQLQGSRTAGLTTSAEKMATAEQDVRRVSATAAAMSEVEKTAMTASRGMTMLGRGVGNLTMLMGSVAMSAGRVGGGLASNAYSMLGGNPLLAGGLGALAIYAGSKAYNKDQQATITDTSGFNNSYYQAGGVQAPPSSTYTYQQSRQAPKTTSAAMNISKNDVAYAQSGTYKLQNSQLKGLKPEEAQARLSTQWATLSKSPSALDSMALDLTNMYGPTQANRIMQNLQSGQGAGITSFAGNAGHAGSTGMSKWWGLGAQSGTTTSKQWNQFFGGLSDQSDQTFANKGANAAQQQKGQTLEQAYAAYQKNRKRGSETASIEQLMSGLFDIKPASIQFESLLHPTRPSPETQFQSKNLKGFLEQQFRSGDGGLNGILGNQGDLRKQALSYYGLDTSLKGNKGADALYNAIVNPPKQKDSEDANSTANTLKQMTQIFGSNGVLGSAVVSNALTKTEDVNAQYQAINEITKKIQGQGGTLEQQQAYINKMLSAAGGDPSMGADLFAGAKNQMARQQGFLAPYQTRTQSFASASQTFAAAEKTPLSAGFTQQDKEAAEDAYASKVQEQDDYFKQMLYQQREYEVMRSRAEQDYNTQREYAQEDFSRSRERAEQDYQIMRSRAEADFTRSAGRNVYDFNLQRKRQEEDYNHQVMLMIDQQAKAMYNVYERVNVQRTSSASWLLVNSQDQLKRMQDQESNLDKLRKMGVSNNTIQQMGFTDSANAQQLARFTTEVTNDPKLVKSFNETVAKRLSAAKALVTDDSSQEWDEFNRSYKLAQTRAETDFQTSMKRSRQDFKRGLKEQDDDFQRSLDRQQQDFGISMDRQADAYKLSMDRSAQDLARAAKTIDGNFEDILTAATKKLSGHAQKQAESVLSWFQKVKGETGAVAADNMSQIASIYGIQYTAPKSSKTVVYGNADSGYHVAGQSQKFFAAGGVLPGYGPGSDTIHYKSENPGVPDLSMSGGEGIMVPEWVKAVGGAGAVREMNRKARGLKFASGGVFQNPDARVYMDGEPVSAITKAQILLAERLSHKDFRTLQGSWQAPSSYSGTSHTGPGVVDETPGNFDTQSWLRKVGFAAWGRNFPGAATAGSGAHVHAVSRLDPGVTGSAKNQLTAFANGGDGLSGGHDYGPNPSVIPGLVQQLKQFTNLQLSSGSPGGAGLYAPLSSVIQPMYSGVEKVAASAASIHPFARGMLSGIINEGAKVRYDKEAKKAGALFDAIGGVGGASAPSPRGRNQDIVHQAMRNAGWGEKEWAALYQIVNHESHFDNTAQSPKSTAYGMFQFLDGTWPAYGPKTSDPTLQSKYGMEYIKGKYGNPDKAWQFWQGHNWYANGGVFSGPQQIGVGENGPEMVLPLNFRGAEFLADLMRKINVGSDSKQTTLTGSVPSNANGGGMVNQYQIDRSTNFTGAITVKSNNPAEMLSALQNRQRVTALSQASLGGQRL